jgi:hypothetical protein
MRHLLPAKVVVLTRSVKWDWVARIGLTRRSAPSDRTLNPWAISCWVGLFPNAGSRYLHLTRFEKSDKATRRNGNGFGIWDLGFGRWDLGSGSLTCARGSFR